MVTKEVNRHSATATEGIKLQSFRVDFKKISISLFNKHLLFPIYDTYDISQSNVLIDMEAEQVFLVVIEATAYLVEVEDGLLEWGSVQDFQVCSSKRVKQLVHLNTSFWKNISVALSNYTLPVHHFFFRWCGGRCGSNGMKRAIVPISTARQAHELYLGMVLPAFYWQTLSAEVSGPGWLDRCQ